MKKTLKINLIKTHNRKKKLKTSLNRLINSQNPLIQRSKNRIDQHSQWIKIPETLKTTKERFFLQEHMLGSYHGMD